MRNIFLRETALVKTLHSNKSAVLPVDWGPEAEYSGVVDVANMDDTRRRIQEYSSTLYYRLKDDFTVEKLAYQLWSHNGDLRRCVQVIRRRKYLTLSSQ